jgi:EF hand domain-containing protein
MIKTLMALAVAGAFALPMAASAAGDSGASTRQEGANPPGTLSPGTPRSAASGADRDTGAAAHGNPTGNERAASGRSARDNFDRLDKNHDGYVSRDEAKDAAELNTRFSELDRNNDGKLSRDEYDALNASSRGARGATGTGRSSSMGSAPTGKGPGSQDAASRPLGGGADAGASSGSAGGSGASK